MREKIWNKLLSLALVLSLVLSCTVPALGASPDAVQPEQEAAVDTTPADSADALEIVTPEQANVLRTPGVTYTDGTYEGTGEGRNGAITLSVTIKDGAIVSVTVVSHKETTSYWNRAVTILDSMTGLKSAEEVDAVDGVSKATLSCDGIKAAVKDALKKAESTTKPEPEPAEGPFASGTGTQDDPFVIRTEAQLRAFAAAVNAGTDYAEQFVLLDADVDLSSAQWTPIGRYDGDNSIGFAGTFDGAGHVITGLAIGTASEPANVEVAGLFGIVSDGGRILNLGVTGASICNYLTDAEERPCVGIIAAVMEGGSKTAMCAMDGCYATGTISGGAATDQYGYAGGLVGSIGWGGVIANSWADVDITTSGSAEQSVGGVLGQSGNNTVIINCAAFGDVSGAGYGYHNVGGLVGMMSGALINSYATGNVTTDAISYGDMPDVGLGALVGGPSYELACYNCYYNRESVQTVNSTEKVDGVYPIGMCEWTYESADDTHCFAQSAADFTTADFAAKLNAGLSQKALAAAETYFEGYISNNSLAQYLELTDSGWQSWAVEDGKLVPGGEITPTPESPFASGDGSEAAPYVIATEAQLRAFAESVNKGTDYSGKYVKLNDDITLSGDWAPIGYSTEAVFDGSFDGRGHSVTGVTVGTDAAPATYTQAGFFGYLGGNAIVSNLNLKNVSIYVKAPEGERAYAGALAATSGVLVDGCSATGSVAVHTVDQYAYAGGLIANQRGTVANSWADVDADGQSDDGMVIAGGLVAMGGNNNGFVMNCAAFGDVFASGYNFSSKLSVYAGGLIGMPTGTIYNCTASGNVALSNKVTADTPNLGGAFGGMYASCVAVNVYYNSEASQTVDGTPVADKLAIGNNGGHTRDVTAKTASQLSSASFASVISGNLSDAKLRAANTYLVSLGYEQDEFAQLRSIVPSWHRWTLTGSKVLPNGDSYVQPEPETIFASGDGSEEDPYLIMTVEQLKAFAASFSDTKDWAGVNIALGADLDISGEQWTPIGVVGDDGYYFQGTFDGQGHAIRGLTIGSASEPFMDTKGILCFGLFAALGESATVKNLGVTDAAIYVHCQASVLAGPLAGISNGAGIDGCYASGIVKTKTLEDGNNFAGGLVGEALYGYIINSWTNTDVDSEAKMACAEAGGIAALAAFGTVANCYALGDASGWTDRTVDDGGVAYVAGLVGCQAGNLANCYTVGDVISRSWSTMVGALAGMSSGISMSSYNYYNSEAKLSIDGLAVDPVEPFGTTVGSGVSDEDGTSFSGSLITGNEALTAAELASQTLVDKLNANFAHFPVNVAQELPQGVTLKTWILKDGVVTLGSDAAKITYVPVEPEEEPVVYVDGTYYGRANGTGDAYLLVKLVVEGGKVVSIDVVSHGEPDGFDAIASPVIDAALAAQEAPELDSGDGVSLAALKKALIIAFNKALLGDTTGYDMVDPSIFAGGNGTAEDPFQIANETQLRAFAASVNAAEDYEDLHVALTADIELTQPWVPVGGAGAHVFCGSFDGQGHVISNLTIGSADAAANYVASGLFANVEGAVIENVGLKNASVHVARTDTARVYVGLIAAAVNEGGQAAVINNCSVSGEIYASSNSWCMVGGISANCYDSIISNCAADVDIVAESPSSSVDAGCLVGIDGFAGLLNNMATGSVTATAGVNSVTIGGLAGMQAGVAINNYTDAKLVSTRSTVDVGGITGRNTGIAAMYTNYFSSDAEQRYGNTVNDPNVAVGTNVTMGSTGIMDNLVGKTSAELRTEAFRDLLNSVREDKTLLAHWTEDLNGYGVTLAQDIAMDSWIVSESGLVIQANTPDIWKSTPDPEPQDPCAAFTDINRSAWYHAGVDYVIANGIMNGMSATTFVPSGTVTRAQLVTILYRMAGSPAVTEVSSFSDVPTGKWYSNAIAWAEDTGVVNGYPDGTFRLDTPISREQIATVLFRYSGAEAVGEDTLAQFPDAGTVSSFAREGMRWAVGQGLINGIRNTSTGATTLSPKATAERAQIAVIIQRFAEK